LLPEGLLENKSSFSGPWAAAAIVFLAGAGLDEVDGGGLEDGGENRSSPPNRSA
jgi:hypothetical protein